MLVCSSKQNAKMLHNNQLCQDFKLTFSTALIKISEIMVYSQYAVCKRPALQEFGRRQD